MRRKLAWLVLAACFLLIGPSVFAQQKAVAVSTFANGRGVRAEDANTITNLVIGRLTDNGMVRVVDRTSFDKILAEMKFQDSDWSNKEKTAALGKAVSADFIIRGEIDLMDGIILITARMIDMEAQVVASSDIEMERMAQARSKMPEFVDRFIATLTRTGGSSGRGGGNSGRSGAVPEGFVRIEGGTFIMGSPASEAERGYDETQHQVTVSGFYMGKYAVSQAEYKKVMKGENPSYFKGDNLPVENVSWYDAIEYCNARSRQEGLREAYTIDKSRFDPNNTGSTEYDTIRWIVTVNKNANGYRLPTEAEWEYACRAGTTTPFNTGNNITTRQANYNGNYPYNGNNKGEYREETVPVDSFYPNRWGLYNMHGNVWEWCWDWYDSSYYGSNAQTDPAGAASGSYRVNRGGSWSSDARNLRSAARSNNTPSARLSRLGFRVVCP